MSKVALSYRYQHLFDMLHSLGFEQRVSVNDSSPRVFFHVETDTLLAFNRGKDETVTSADLLSTEVHLHSKGIIQETLESMLSTTVAH